MKPVNKMDYKGLKVSMPIIGYGGMVHAQYMSSMIQLVNNCAAAGISVDCPLIWFESLISRARNSSAAAALSSNCDYLFFVADSKTSHYFSKTYKEHLNKIKELGLDK